MNRITITFTDGTELRGCIGNPLRGRDTATGRTLTWRADLSALVDGDEVVRRVEARPAGATTAGTSRSRSRSPARSSTSSPARRASRERFATFNAFIDTVARHLSPLEVVVWTIVFRDCRDGTASTSGRDLARRSGCSLRAVYAAVKRLRDARLITAVKLSTNKGEPSVYAVHPEPDRLVPDLIDRRTSRTGARRASVAQA